ncbi:MAG: hypothetical protein AAGE99_04935 [Chlamydiota bacterium]
MQRGKRLEAKARKAFEKDTGLVGRSDVLIRLEHVYRKANCSGIGIVLCRLPKRQQKPGEHSTWGSWVFYDPLITQPDQKPIRSSTDSAFFYQYVGSDGCFSKLLLGSNTDSHSFGKSELPKVSPGINKEQPFALKTLLSSGTR